MRQHTNTTRARVQWTPPPNARLHTKDLIASARILRIETHPQRSLDATFQANFWMNAIFCLLAAATSRNRVVCRNWLKVAKRPETSLRFDFMFYGPLSFQEVFLANTCLHFRFQVLYTYVRLPR